MVGSCRVIPRDPEELIGPSRPHTHFNLSVVPRMTRGPVVNPFDDFASPVPYPAMQPLHHPRCGYDICGITELGRKKASRY